MSGENSLKGNVMKAHSELVKAGSLDEAWLILRFLQNGKITLGLGDLGARVEGILEALGCAVFYSGNFNHARFYLRYANS